DWADGEKDDRAQRFAAFAAVSLAEHVLGKPDVLAHLGARAKPGGAQAPSVPAAGTAPEMPPPPAGFVPRLPGGAADRAGGAGEASAGGKGPAPRVFLSHSSHDKEFVRRLADDLMALDLKIWLDERELGPGESIVGGISGGLREADYLIVVLSRAS